MADTPQDSNHMTTEQQLLIDGSQGEGGGQVLRTTLSLAMITHRPIRIERIRANREKPGLRRQHLTALEACAQICDAQVRGAEIGSQTVDFSPGRVVPGDYEFSVGTAGSLSLVMQTLLPALMLAPAPSQLALEGGTHNPMAPSFEFLEKVFLSSLGRMGPKVSIWLRRPGFFPAGGGLVVVHIAPLRDAHPLHLVERGPLKDISATAMVAHLPGELGRRQLQVVSRRLNLDFRALEEERRDDSLGPGNAVMVSAEFQAVTGVFSGFGGKNISAEVVAEQAVTEAMDFLDSDVPVCPHLADQLLLPMALLKGGTFRTMAPTRHFRTNAEIIGQFLGDVVHYEQRSPNDWLVEVQGRL